MIVVTRQEPATHWLVEVKDPGDVMLGIPMYVRRFKFTSEIEAWSCVVSAVSHGFDGRVFPVRAGNKEESR